MSEDLITQMSIALQPYKDTVGLAATWLTIGQMLSPMLVLNDMRKAKSTLGMPVYMFLLGLVL